MSDQFRSPTQAAAPALSEQSPPEQKQPKAAPAVSAKEVLKGLPSTGFSESWLRQFMQQMPTKAAPLGPTSDTPCMGRRVLSASGDQMVYVDELSPNEVLCLLQMAFLLEEKLRRSDGNVVDLAQRVPHTFGFLQVDPAIDVMLKKFFDELPHQCGTTGLRFATREKLRKHNDNLYRRRSLAQFKQRGSEARGWMETIPEWVGNRDLVVGPALFKLGVAGSDENQAAGNSTSSSRTPDGSLGRSAMARKYADDDMLDGWVCPLDERRSVCPISGELFSRTWSAALNDWVVTDAAAIELGGTNKPLRFDGQQRLSETAMLFKASCFQSTPPLKRLRALHDCAASHAWATDSQGDEVKTTMEVGSAQKPCAARRRAPPARKFF